MKQLTFLVTALLVAGQLCSQVVVTLQLPPLGLTIKPQLWNLSLINTSGIAMTAQVKMIMSDAATGQTVLTGTTPTMLLSTGANAITPNKVSPVTYTAGPGYTIDGSPNGFLPVGVFNICYSITKWTNDITDQIAEECITAEVEPISPPQLLQPGDSDRVLTRRPFFTWLPPSPVNVFSNLTYDLVLAQVQPMQSGPDAVQQNVPLLLQYNIAFTSLQYPLSMPELDTGKTYAWRVTAKSNGSPVANSEVWSFKVPLPDRGVTGKNGNGYYAPLRRTQDASYSITTGALRFVYTHDGADTTVSISITDISTKAHQLLSLDDAEQTVHYGDNYLLLDLGNTSGMTDHHMYLLTLVNSKKEQWFLKVEYRKLNQ